jgi:glucokinase
LNAAADTTFLRILAADIGGTHARFAAVRVDGPSPKSSEIRRQGAADEAFRTRLGAVFEMATRQAGAGSFMDFWRIFRRQAPAELAEIESFDAVALALAGAVSGQSAVLPNIDWNIEPADVRSFAHLYLLNDFVAQGHALTLAGALGALEQVREGQPSGRGNIALVGAGTGLGHCVLYPPEENATPQAWRVAGSEAGHCSFAFVGERERRIEQDWLQASGRRWLSNDEAVSGAGLVALHTALTGRVVSPALALEHAETAACFSRFYGRACRNYCLSVFPVDCLVISGGIAARNPGLVRSNEFSESFNDGGDYRELLARIPIRLNTDPHIGIRGAAVYAAKTLLSAL